ncbi:MAG: hypothetical protein WD068_00225 [Candidatus Babeliales bacterium]
MKTILFASLLLCSPYCTAGRSVHRPKDPLCPTIQTYWPNDTTKYTLNDWHLEEIPIFHTFDKENFQKHMLPIGDITYRNHPEHSVLGTTLAELANHVLEEIEMGNHSFTHFKKLKVRDFSENDHTGLAILKYKKYPFVLKLFIEKPESFVKPYSKGFEPIMFFWMGSTMRHLTGFGRIKNLERIKERLASNPIWAQRVDVPRKWFWEPKNNKYFIVEGINIGREKKQTVELPSVYGIICDAIESPHHLSLIKIKNRDECLEIARFLDYNLDPHLPNFLPEKDTNKLVIIDTEHFPALTGLKQKLEAKSYIGWYMKISYKAFKDQFCRSKPARRNMQKKLRSSYYPF